MKPKKCPGCGGAFSKLRKCDACGCCVDCFHNLELPSERVRAATTPSGQCYCELQQADTSPPGAA